MHNTNRSIQWSCGLFILALTALLVAGCRTGKDECCSPTAAGATAPAPAPDMSPAVATPPAVAPVAAPAPAPVPVMSPVRIKAGSSAEFKDSDGNVWLGDQGFVDGETAERSDAQIANTKTPAIYVSERYSMTAFSHPVPNGKYTVKLHFAETYDGITGAGQRVFSFNVEGHEFKDFDVWVKAGGGLRAYVETVNVEVTDGKLDITFTSNVENPEINGIEIIPGS